MLTEDQKIVLDYANRKSRPAALSAPIRRPGSVFGLLLLVLMAGIFCGTAWVIFRAIR